MPEATSHNPASGSRKRRRRRSQPQATTPAPVPARIVAAAVALALLLLMAHQWHLSLAGLYLSNANSYIDVWAKTGTISTQADWQLGLHQAQQAQQRNPTNPHANQTLGLAYEWAEAIPNTSPQWLRQQHKTALSYYNQNTALRPTSPWGWWQVFRARVKLAYYNPKTQQAWHNTVATGPNEPETLLGLIDAALLAQPYTSQFTQGITSLTQQLLSNTTNNQLHWQLIRSYKTHQQLPWLCQQAVNANITSKPLQNACKNQPKTSN